MSTCPDCQLPHDVAPCIAESAICSCCEAIENQHLNIEGGKR